MTTINRQVAADEDDAFDYDPTSQAEGSNFLWMSYTDSTILNTAMRFLNITISQGDLIEDGTVIQVKPNGTLYDNPAIDIYAEDADNPGAIEGGTELFTRTKTTAFVNWTAVDNPPGFSDSPGIKTVIQEVIDRGGWSSGNALVIITDNTGSTALFMSDDYQASPADAVKLVIIFTAGGTPALRSQRLKSGVGR